MYKRQIYTFPSTLFSLCSFISSLSSSFASSFNIYTYSLPMWTLSKSIFSPTTLLTPLVRYLHLFQLHHVFLPMVYSHLIYFFLSATFTSSTLNHLYIDLFLHIITIKVHILFHSPRIMTANFHSSLSPLSSRLLKLCPRPYTYTYTCLLYTSRCV